MTKTKPTATAVTFSEADRLNILERAVADHVAGRAARLKFQNGQTLEGVLLTFRHDRRSCGLGLELGLSQDAYRSEVAATLAGRFGMQFDPPQVDPFA